MIPSSDQAAVLVGCQLGIGCGKVSPSESCYACYAWYKPSVCELIVLRGFIRWFTLNEGSSFRWVFVCLKFGFRPLLEIPDWAFQQLQALSLVNLNYCIFYGVDYFVLSGHQHWTMFDLAASSGVMFGLFRFFIISSQRKLSSLSLYLLMTCSKQHRVNSEVLWAVHLTHEVYCSDVRCKFFR